MNLDFQPNDEDEIFAKIQNLQTLAISKKKKVSCIIEGHHKDAVTIPPYQTFGGFNIEFSSSDVIHAERMALISCLSEGYYPVKIWVTSSRSEGEPTYLCGYCRQLMHEVNAELLITVFNPDGSVKGRTRLDQAFPNAGNTSEKNKMFSDYCRTRNRFDIDWSKV